MKQYKNTVNKSTRISKTNIQLSKHSYNKNPHLDATTNYKTHTYTHPHITKPTHTHTLILQNKLKQPQYKISLVTKLVTIQSSSHNTFFMVLRTNRDFCCIGLQSN